MKPCRITEDERPIKQITWADGQGWICVGREGVTKIVAYDEKGVMDFVPWLAVYKEDVIWQRIDAAGKEITYAE